MDRLRKAVDELVAKAKLAIQGEPKSPVELLLDEHLSLFDDLPSFSPRSAPSNVAIPTFVLNDLAARTKNIVDYPVIMRRIWAVMEESENDPAVMRKALNLLHYLLINGSIQVLKDCHCIERMAYLEDIASQYNRSESEQYQFSKHLDIGAGVRKTATDICILLTNEREIMQARRSAERLHQSLSDRGLRSAYPSPKGESPASASLSSYEDGELRPARFTDTFPTGPQWADNALPAIVTHSEEAVSAGDSPVHCHNSAVNRYASHQHISSPRLSGRHSSFSSPNSSGSYVERPPGLPTAQADLLELDTLPSAYTTTALLLGDEEEQDESLTTISLMQAR